MHKALLPMIAVLLLSGAATIALVATNARAEQSGHRPMMIALVAPGRTTAAPPAEGGSPPPRRAMREAGREQICRDVYAGKAGELAFLEAKLSLDAKQAPLFARWKQASLDIAKQNEGDCAAPRRDLRSHRPSAVDRMTLEEDLLKKRLADIQAERPALTAFYNALTPAQKEEFSHSDTRHMPGRFNVMFGMLDRPHPGMEMMHHGPMSGPMNGPQDGPMGGPPPLAR